MMEQREQREQRELANYKPELSLIPSGVFD
jgi:hypothetical protein